MYKFELVRTLYKMTRKLKQEIVYIKYFAIYKRKSFLNHFIYVIHLFVQFSQNFYILHETLN